ncbi:hypothetical protein [Corynebacterium cystitidis]|nr:hypothetical protein [Corynebacterium cystitidis]
MNIFIANNLDGLGFSDGRIASMVADAEAGAGSPDRLDHPVAEFFLTSSF